MGLLSKLKLLFKARQPVTDIINEVKAVQAGYKTIPFWVALIGSALALVAALQGLIPATAALIATTVLTAIYNILRGATKADVTATKPITQTTEFWMGILAQVSNALVSLQTGGINPKWMATAAMVIGAAMAAGQNLGAQSTSGPMTNPPPPSPGK